MKKFAKSLLSTAVFLTYASKTYAAENVTKGNNGIGKIALLGAGVVLIALVLFIGYKLDSIDNSEKKPKKEKIKKEKNKKEKKSKNNDVAESTLVEDVYKTANEEDVPYEVEENEKYENDKINLSEINENIEYTDDGDEESLFESVSKVKGYDTFVDEEDFDEFSISEIKKEEPKNKNFDSTMVFDTNVFSSFDDEENNEKEEIKLKSEEQEIIVDKKEDNLFENNELETEELDEDIDISKFKPENNSIEDIEQEEFVEFIEEVEDSKEEFDIFAKKNDLTQNTFEELEEDKDSEDVEEMYEMENEEDGYETENLDLVSKIDELDDYIEEEHDIFGNLPNVVSLPPKKYDEDIEEVEEDVSEENEEVIEDFLGFSTEDSEETTTTQVSSLRRFTRKVINGKHLTSRPYPNAKNEEVLDELPNVVIPQEEKKEEIETENEEVFVDYNFLAQMEENLVKTKNKRLGIDEFVEKKEKATKKTSETKKNTTKKNTTKKETAKKETAKKETAKKETAKKETAKKETTKKASTKTSKSTKPKTEKKKESKKSEN